MSFLRLQVNLVDVFSMSKLISDVKNANCIFNQRIIFLDIVVHFTFCNTCLVTK